IPLDIKPSLIELIDHDQIQINWNDGHQTTFPISFLLKHSYDPPCLESKNLALENQNQKQFWDQSISQSLPTVSFNDLCLKGQTGQWHVLNWLRKINKIGFCLVDNLPPTPEATEKLLRKISFIRQTHYGAFWDFTADLKHGDTAYTNLALGAHTDTTYFSDPAGLQLFHLLSPPTSHQGGKSLLVDGFFAAFKLKLEDLKAYNILSTVPVETHASGGKGVAFKPILPQPIFSHHPRTGELMIIRWNPDDRKPLGGLSGHVIKDWYHAIRKWEIILKSKKMELWFPMKTGQALIFDNHRVLHGRSSFTGSRRLCGGYINGDDYRSRLRSLEFQFKETHPSGPIAPQTPENEIWNDID
ncbi:hypothetical protein O181_102451, partial [Austropuccinia psidii MF-1]|nr:hypothetical protein [Austropuccinia psidii MF-1]